MNSEESRGSEMHDNPEPEPIDPQETSEDMTEGIGEEYANLDEALDQIGSYLDQLEAKNDDIYSRLQDLLESNRRTRQELEAERIASETKQMESNDSKSSDGPVER